MSDGELAYRLWDKDYKGRVPMGQFADSIKLSPAGFGQMVNFAESTGYTPTTESGQAQPVGSATGAPRAALQGMTFGFGDEIVGGMAGGITAAGNVIRGQPANLGGEMQRFTEQERQRIGQFRQEAPVTAIGSEVAGAVARRGSGPTAASDSADSTATEPRTRRLHGHRDDRNEVGPRGVPRPDRGLQPMIRFLETDWESVLFALLVAAAIAALML